MLREPLFASEGILKLSHASHRFVEPLEARKLFAAYYVSPTGNDAASGLSPAEAWRTVERVNQHYLRGGTWILFEGGKTFDGNLYVSSREAGRADKPVVITSYGPGGRATIRSGAKVGLHIVETAGVAATNLNFVGGRGTSSGSTTSGIYIHAGSANKILSSLHIRNVDVKNYGREGFTLIASGPGSSISDVKIERSAFHDNLLGGINITGNSGNLNANKNYLIDHVKAYNNAGVMADDGFVSGSGIYLADVDTAVVQRCVVWNNGAGGVAPVGIWAAGANNVTFQYNESYGNRTASSSDGGGFDFDWNVTNSLMQYNFSHDNDGPGYMLGGGPTMNRGNVIRYNISQNDGRKNGKGAIYIWGGVNDAQIYNNTIFLSATRDSGNAAVRASDVGASGKVPQNISIRNNIFYATGGAKLVNLTSNIAGKSRFAFNGNAWYSGGGAFTIQWGGSGYNSLAAWQRATGQETTRSVPTGYQGNPRLIAPGTAKTVGNADRLAEALLPYRLHKRSALINRGRPYPSTVFIPPARTDFFGEVLPATRADIGADEIR